MSKKDLTEDYIVINNTRSNETKVAAFDLDWTIIRPNKGVHPKDYEDWVLLDKNAADKFNKLREDGYKIVVFSNQTSTNFDKCLFTKKINEVSKALGFGLHVYVSTCKHGIYRKPLTGMWDLFISEHAADIDMESSFYVGDAAGREKGPEKGSKADFSDSDLKFALNIGIDFKTPEEFYETRTVKYSKNIPHPLDKYRTETTVKTTVEASDTQEMLVLVGAPGSGKSTFCKNIQFEKYRIVSQDELVSKLKTIGEAKKLIKEGHSVIIDRTNAQIKNRGEFIKLAKDLGIRCRIIWLNTPVDVCKHLAKYRELCGGENIPDIVYNMYYSKTKGLETPTVEEGVDSVVVVPFVLDLANINSKLFESHLT